MTLFQEREAQIEFLRQEARKKYDGNVKNTSTTVKNEKNINFFSDLEDGKLDYEKGNKQNEKEKREEKEEYEKKIGYLTYLGQDTQELKGETSWYNKERQSESQLTDNKIEKKRKSYEDPIYSMNKYLKQLGKGNKMNEAQADSTGNKRRKLESTSSKGTDGKSSLDQLRAKRLLREQREKLKTEALLQKLQGTSKPVQSEPSNNYQKYNSQYFPEFAKQNVRRNSK